MHLQQQLFLSIYVDDFKMAGKAENIGPMWKKIGALIDLDPPVPLHGTTYLGCTQYETEPRPEDLIWCRKMHHDLIHAVTSNATPLESATGLAALTDVDLANCRTYFHETTGHSKLCVDKYCEVAQVERSSLKPADTPCLDDHQTPMQDLSPIHI